MINVLFFARLAELAERSSIRLEHREDITVRMVVDDLEGDLPQELINHLKYDVSMISINKVMADWDDVLENGDEVAFLPPFSGG